MIESSDEQIGVTRLYCKGDNISSFTGFSVRVGVHGGSKDGIGYVFGLFAGLKMDCYNLSFGTLVTSVYCRPIRHNFGVIVF